jgi:hypothetical protein
VTLSTRLQHLTSAVGPSSDAKIRILSRIRQRIDVPKALQIAASAATPDQSAYVRVWEHVAAAIHASPVAFLDRIRAAILPPMERSAEIWRLIILPRLVPQPSPVQRSRRALAWVTAVAVLVVAVRVSPVLFVPPIAADSPVTLMPTRGAVLVWVGGLWQPVVGEMTLVPGMQLKTEDSEASILLRDDGVIRMDRGTTLTLLDLSERMEPAPEVLPTLALEQGRIWLQGLIPGALRGITVALPQGHVTVHEGSTSVAAGDLATIEVYNRSILVLRDARETRLLAGERVQLWDGGVVQVRRIPALAYSDPWVNQNIARDAVHRRDIAQLQQERRVARAGILPTSKLYAVKRAAETVDVLLTFDERTRVEKQIAYAGIRLDEAAALMEQGDAAAVEAPLAEYRRTLVALAGTSTDESTAQFLLQQAVSEATARTAAAVPGDDAYLLKRAVLEALSELPGKTLTKEDVLSELLVDSLAALTQAVAAGGVTDLTAAWMQLQPSLALLDSPDAGFSAATVQEVKTLLERFAVALTESAGQVTHDSVVLRELTEFLPREPAVRVAQLTDGQVLAVATAIKDRVFTYRMPRSRHNQMITELRDLQGNPDAGRVLRALYHAMPKETELLTPVRRAITQLNWATVAEQGTVGTTQ